MHLNDLLVAALLILGSISRSSEHEDGHEACVASYHELRDSVFALPENVDNLRRAIFPTNQEPSISAEIHYYLKNSTLQHPLIFRWSESWSLAFIRPELLQSLTLHIFAKMPPSVYIVVDPPCDDPDLNSSLSDSEELCRDEKMASSTLLLLNELTANVS